MPTIELVPVSALHPAPYNPREADTERLELVALSLRKLGFLLPLVATKDGEILSGHQRHRMAAAMGASRVPVFMRIYRGPNDAASISCSTGLPMTSLCRIPNKI